MSDRDFWIKMNIDGTHVPELGKADFEAYGKWSDRYYRTMNTSIVASEEHLPIAIKLVRQYLNDRFFTPPSK